MRCYGSLDSMFLSPLLVNMFPFLAIVHRCPYRRIIDTSTTSKNRYKGTFIWHQEAWRMRCALALQSAFSWQQEPEGVSSRGGGLSWSAGSSNIGDHWGTGDCYSWLFMQRHQHKPESHFMDSKRPCAKPAKSDFAFITINSSLARMMYSLSRFNGCP